MYHNHPPTVSYPTTHRQPPSSPLTPNTLTFEQPQELTLESGLVVWDIKPKKPKNSLRVTKPVIENPQVTEIKIYTEKLVLGGDWQGEVIAPITSSGGLDDAKATHYLVRNVWLELIGYQVEYYIFRIQAAFMVPLPKVVYLYQQNSRIIVNKNVVKCNG
ncbi:hypothetical protein [Microscilla marina]|uniref:hypothetical protein n=1 Tax=Microscilla marina TaxID=1027 RepID=UPI0012F9CA19|nr:hypothetical protein [Microscilla marina]